MIKIIDTHTHLDAEEFDELKRHALGMGFAYVESAPLQ